MRTPLFPSLRRLLGYSIPFVAAIMLGFAGGKLFAPLINSLRSQTQEGDYRSHFHEKDEFEVVLYGTSSCKHCIRARQYLIEKGIKFYDARIDEQPSASEQYDRLGLDYIPAIVTRNSLIKGFYAEAIDKTLRPQMLNQ